MALELKANQLFVLDFDGVVCDSNPEVYTTSFLAFLDLMEIDIPLRRVLEERVFYDLFLKYRNLGRFPPDFLNLWLTALKEIKEDFKQTTNLSDGMKSEYRKLYFIKRNYLKREGLKDWLSLHVFYTGMEELIRELFSSKILYIASAKDETSISQILENKRIIFDQKYILGSENYSDKDEMFLEIEKNKNSRRVIFIDDNVINLDKALEYGFECYFANWGYGEKTMINQNAIHVLDLEQINQFLPNSI